MCTPEEEFSNLFLKYELFLENFAVCRSFFRPFEHVLASRALRLYSARSFGGTVTLVFRLFQVYGGRFGELG